MSKDLRKKLGIPDDWDSQDIDIYKDMMQVDVRNVFRTLIKYLDLKDEPSHSGVPMDFIEKHIKVARHILTHKKPVTKLDKVIDYCRKHNVLP